ncbi:hypothetical protein [Falsiroseomonas sp.]|uniref:hypothetical protein n=1 Tax=Falsiroseomonas sp. TaxID=2870721 RepID=UPI0034A5B191
MSAAAALARAEAVGMRFRLAPGGGVQMEATAPPPADVLADLRRWREDVAHLVAARAALDVAQPVEDWRALPFGPERGEAFMAARTATGACHGCAGRRWWCAEGVEDGLRCLACHPPPPGLAWR